MHSLPRREVLMLLGIVARPPAAWSAAVDDSSGSRVAFFGFHLINTSLDPDTAAEDRRIHQLDDLFRQKLDASRRFKIVAIPPDMQKEIAAGLRSAPATDVATTLRRGWA